MHGRIKGESMKKSYITTVLLALLLAVTSGWAQTPGSLHGTITDDSGSVVPGAKVRVSGAGVTKNTSTNVQGVYTVTGLPAGDYTVRVTMPGFTNFEGAGVSIATSQAAALNVTLRSRRSEEHTSEL